METARHRTLGGWQHDTLTEDTDLSFRAQLMGWKFVYLLDEDAPSELPVEAGAFKAQQRRWAKGVTEVGLKLYPRILRADLPRRVKLEMFFRLTGNISYPLMILVSLLQFPLLLVRYNQGFHNLVLLDAPLLFFSTLSVVFFYGTAIWHLDGRDHRRLAYLPMVMALAPDCASNARAVLEALCGVKTEFVRTPKYKVEGGGDQSWKRQKKYRRKLGLLPFVELSFAAYFLLAILYAARMGMWATIPFLCLYLFGYGYIGIASLAPGANVRRLVDALRARRTAAGISLNEGDATHLRGAEDAEGAGGLTRPRVDVSSTSRELPVLGASAVNRLPLHSTKITHTGAALRP